MFWQLSCGGLCLVLIISIGRRLFAVHALEQRARLQPRSFVLGRGFHRPLYGACWLLLLLRAAFFTLTISNQSEELKIPLKMATFWLLDMPSVAMTALNGYILLFAVRLVFRRRWPGTTSSGSNGVLGVVYVAFCASLVALVTLVAVDRAQRDARGLVVPHWVTFGYSAVIWTTLGLLGLKYWGQAVRILWRYRRRNQWTALDGDETSTKTSWRLPVLGISCLKSLAMCSTLLAELLIVRGISCFVAASQDEVGEMDVTSWRSVLVHYFSWEVVSVAIVLRMLHQTPIAVHYPSEESRNGVAASMQRVEAPSAPELDGGEIQIQFEVPHVRELVAEYVVPSNASLLFARRRGMELESNVETRYCREHHAGAPSAGAEYVGCRCCRHTIDDRFLSNANVPLLAEEQEPLDDETSCTN
ncbi:hypothetical protein PR001_g541 [Phytophthora rubi]|uniref:Uncharacterized protein n=2 Tax=Phytophthora rubi TaxID=129364 RepID=A0A6A3P371_9STRA|nr:hypothetical protein PR001_g541 [Phytophthora rubi]